MKNISLKKFIVIFIAGLIGVVTIAFSEIPLPEEIKKELLQHTSQQILTLVILINPTILLLVMTLLGLFLQPKTNLKTPVIDQIVSVGYERINPGFFSYGLALGFLTGIAITFWSYLFYPYLPESIKSLNENIELSVLTRIFYGGITEEILLRYGFMTVLVWLFLKVKKSGISYWTAIIFSSLVFGVGHLPIVYSTVESVDNLLILYIIFGNTIGGIAYGWLYWKKGLESAMIAHIMTHLTMITIQ